MKQLLLGHRGSKKTTMIEQRIRTYKEQDIPTIVFDFNNEYGDSIEDVLYLDKLNPVLGDITLSDAMAINAGYIPKSRALVLMCEDILRETKQDKREYLIEEAVDRMHGSWDASMNKHAPILTSKLKKRNATQYSARDAVSMLLEKRQLLIRSKNMLSDDLRAASYALLSKLSHSVSTPVQVILDEQTVLFPPTNMPLLLRSLSLQHLHITCCFNKVASVPSALLPIIDTVTLFHLKKDFSELEHIGITPDKEWQRLKKGECVHLLYPCGTLLSSETEQALIS